MPDKPVGREILSLALGAAIGGAVSYGFQVGAADREREAELREARRTAATQVFQEVGRLMDARFYRLVRLGQAVERHSTDSTHWQAGYDSLTQLWHERLPTNVAVFCHYLGSRRAGELREVSVGLSELRRRIKDNAAGKKRLAEAVRQQIFVLELEVADQLRKGEIFETDVDTQGCVDLEPNRSTLSGP
jgi:hypothetical protein